MRNVLRMAVLFLSASVAFAQTSKLATDLSGVSPSSSVNVIIQYDHVPNQGDHQKVYHQGGTLYRAYQNVKVGGYTVPASALAQLANNPQVTHISPDRAVGAKLDMTAAAVNATAAWADNLDGSGIGVAIIDSGITEVNDLGSRVVYSQDFVGTGTQDFYGHGTHVAGILAGSGADSICTYCTRTLKGIAPNANIINLRVLDQNGLTTDSMLIAAIDQAISLASKYNIRVINLSVGRPVFESAANDPLDQAVEAAWHAGITVVVAAGNDGRNNYGNNNGYGTITAPGNDPLVITVGAMKTEGTASRTDDRIASYSSKGPTAIDNYVKPDLVAPGNLVVSLLGSTDETLPTTYPSLLIPESYYYSKGGATTSGVYYTLSGTSMATPVVSGAAALLLQQQPSLTPDQIKARLMKTAYKTFPSSSTATDTTTGTVYTSYYDIFTVGAGYLDVGAALKDTTIWQGQAASPVAVFSNGTPQLSFSSLTTCSDPQYWAMSAIWGTTEISGTTIWTYNAALGKQAVSATQAIWGTVSAGAQQAIWGSQAIWGTQAISGTQAIWGSQGIWGTIKPVADTSLVGEK